MARQACYTVTQANEYIGMAGKRPAGMLYSSCSPMHSIAIVMMVYTQAYST